MPSVADNQDVRGLVKTSGVSYLRIRAESSNKSEIMKQASHAAASGQLNQQQFHPRPVLEEYWKRPHEPLPSLTNVENTDDPAERREKPVPAHYETSESRLVHNNEHTLTYPTRQLLPRAREIEKVSKA